MENYEGPLHHDAGLPEVVPMTRLQVALAREIGGWPLYTIIIGLGQMISATSFQITLLTGRNWEDNLQLYVLGGVFLAASFVWYPLFRMMPSVYILSIPWIFFGLAFFMIGLPSIATAIVPAHRALANAATWSYAIASAASFAFFGLNFGEEAVRISLYSAVMFPDLSLTGCRDRSLDHASVYRPGIAADMGRRFVVLGLYVERRFGQLRPSLVYLYRRVATRSAVVYFCLPDALRSSW
jgi:hypothetical protein